MTTQFHEHDRVEPAELSGLVLVLTILALAGILVWLCT